jgi:cation-transporting ATPase 13A1
MVPLWLGISQLVLCPYNGRMAAYVAVTRIIQQGRCTLVTTMQMYKILALNCLIQAYALSVLYLDGIKLSDTQATTAGLLIASCFLFISLSKPLEKLSREKPCGSIFSAGMLLSLIGQFAIHLASLASIVHFASQYSQESSKAGPEGEFVPNLVNTAVFLITSSMQVATFAVNYKGHPFMQSLKENKPLMWGLSVMGILTFVAATEVFSFLNEYIELAPMPTEFRGMLLGVMVLDVVFVFCWDRVIIWLGL